LTEVRKYQVVEVEQGIYEVRGDYLPIQLIETKKLSRENNQWLKDLARDLEREEMRSMIQEGEWKGKETPLDAYLDALIRANSKVFEEVFKMPKKYPTMEEILEDLGIAAKVRDEGREEGKEQRALEIAQRLLKKGWSIEDVAETTALDTEKIRAVGAPPRKAVRKKRQSPA
jgi:predicted transposase YdaD